MADHVGAAAAALAPLHTLIARHVLDAERLHGDDTTVPVLALSAAPASRRGIGQSPMGRTITGRLWAYVRDDRPFGGPDPPAVLFHYSRDRRGVHPQAHLAGYAGILQADAYSGLGGLYAPTRPGGVVTEALCWAHARRRVPAGCAPSPMPGCRSSYRPPASRRRPPLILIVAHSQPDRRAASGRSTASLPSCALPIAVSIQHRSS